MAGGVWGPAANKPSQGKKREKRGQPHADMHVRRASCRRDRPTSGAYRRIFLFFFFRQKKNTRPFLFLYSTYTPVQPVPLLALLPPTSDGLWRSVEMFQEKKKKKKLNSSVKRHYYYIFFKVDVTFGLKNVFFFSPTKSNCLKLLVRSRSGPEKEKFVIIDL